MKHKTLFILWILMIISLGAQADNLSIIPYPNSVVTHPGSYRFEHCNLSFDKSLKNEAMHLESMLKEDFGVSSTYVKKGADVRLLLSPQFKNGEAYRLQIDKEGVTITASSPQGVFYGIQTLRQVLQMRDNKLCASYLTIDDEPAFRWRAFMLDDARAFKGMEVVKQLLDEMAILKMNTFHWHLTEDQGWRIEIKKYPKLTEIGGTRDSTQLNWYESTTFDGTPLTGYYTQKEIREIVRYAADRHITIIPEIEMPGHASAAIAAYPWLGTSGKTIQVPCAFGVLSEAFNVADPKVLGFLEDVLDEVIELFPSKIIHIGGDEVKYEQWKNSPVVQQFMKEKHIGSPAELQVWFTNHICTYLQSKGRRMMGWNDVTGDKLHHYHDSVEGSMQQKLSSDALVQFWTGDLHLLQKAAESGHEIVNSFHEYTYLNYNHDKITPGLEFTFAPISLEKAYSFSPIPKDFPVQWRNQIIGMGCQMWGEWIPTVRSMYKMVYPYWAAHAETGWTRKNRKDYTRFRNALPYFVTRWTNKGYLCPSDAWTNMTPTQSEIEIPLWAEKGGSYADYPLLTVYLPDCGNGKAIIMCPGGGYGSLAVDHEGHDMAAWFNKLGYVYAVLQYRMPEGHSDVPLSDAKQAMRIMKKQAGEWKVCADKIGIMGASAGGHLASTLATHTVGELHPAFQILFYPVITMKKEYTHAGSRQNLLGTIPTQETIDAYCNELRVTAATPPAFIMLSGDDDVVPVQNSFNYYLSLLEHKVPAEMHAYPSGGHGWGYLDSFKFKKQWTFELEEWLRNLD